VRPREINRFTYEDVKSGVVHYVPNRDDDRAPLAMGRPTVADEFEFRLIANSPVGGAQVQPAVGIFKFTIASKVRFFLSKKQ